MTKSEEEAQAPYIHIHGDLLEAILSHVPLLDLLPPYHVSKAWRRAVCWSLSNPSRAKPWLIVHIQRHRNPSLTLARAYDSDSHVWIDIPRATIRFTSPIRSSHSNLLYMLTPSKLTFSFDALNATWHEVDGPRVWRSDPIVAVVGSHVIVAGGTQDFEDDPLAVETYDIKAGHWEMCQSMPHILKESAATTWISVAVSDQKMFLLEKNSATLYAFDPKTKTWGGMFDLRLNASTFFSLIGFSKNRLILIGLIGDIENVESLNVWEVNCDKFDCTEIGKMPSKMLERLIDSESSPSSINIAVCQDIVYIYNQSDPKYIFFCQIRNSSCDWGNIENSVINDRNQMHRFVFTSSKVCIGDLQKVFGPELGDEKLHIASLS